MPARRIAVALVLLILTPRAAVPEAREGQTPRAHVAMLHAHNCYPEEGRFGDRLDRALATAHRPIAIEQDIVWDAARGASVLSHDTTLSGDEPTLEAHFFERLQPVLDLTLQDGRHESWPQYILHLDFKTNEAAHHAAVWSLLGRYERWLTTAPRTPDGTRVAPLTPGPLLVITENGEGQATAFHDQVPDGQRLRIFGTVPTAVRAATTGQGTQLDAVFSASPDELIPTGATNYRRWVNFSWAVVEHGGQTRAGDWTAADDRRLRAVVDRAHALGLWVRFYTLNGHAPGAGTGWTDSYNFGSLPAVRLRWKAAIDAGLDFVATDQYEEFARMLTEIHPVR